MKHKILAQRLYNQHLTSPLENPQQIVEEALGIQSQYINYGLFNLINRSNSIATKESVCQDLILSWGQRGTYHFYTIGLWQEISQLYQGKSQWPKLLAKRGVEVEKEYELLRQLLLEKSRSRTELKEFYGEEKFKQLFAWGGLLGYAARQGQLYQQLTENDRINHWYDQPLPCSTNLKQELLERYMRFYGPATLKDAAHFFGVPLRFFAEVPLALPFIQIDGQRFYYQEWHEQASIPEVLLLGKFDAMLIAYQSKEILIPKVHQSAVWQKAGQISSILLIQGEYAGNWSFAVGDKTIRYQLEPHQELSEQQQAMVIEKLMAFANFMNKTVKEIRWK